MAVCARACEQAEAAGFAFGRWQYGGVSGLERDPEEECLAGAERS